MELLVSWLLYPIAMVAVLVGCGLLLRTVAGVELPAALLPAVGLAVVICIGHLTTGLDATAELTTPVIVALAVAGYVSSWPLDWRAGVREALPAIAAGTAVFFVYGAPVILSGEATLAGFVKLDDTATWLTLTDRVMEHGRSLADLAPSTYEATLSFNLGDGYPVGAFLPLGAGAELIATDAAWVIQPYMSLLAGILAATMTALLRPLVDSGRIRAAAAFVAAQPALLVGYVLWGGIKEIEAATLIAAAAALAPLAFAPGSRVAAVVPVAVVTAALMAVLSFGGAIWLLPILLVPLVVLWRRSPRSTGRAVALFAAICLLILLPLLAGGQLLPPTSSPLTSADAQGNLFEPLNPFQVAGVWPVGDFRLRPDQGVITAIAIAVAIAAAAYGVIIAARRRASGLLLYWGAIAAGAVALVLIGSPWVEGKALATAAPGVLLAAMAGVAVLYERGLRLEAALIALIVAGGVLASNFLGYRDVNLAPREQLEELELIGKRIEGEGATLMTEYSPYGARHFLREADPESASELRRRVVPLLDGEPLEKGLWADTDRFQPSGLFEYRTLVLRRSPAQSRPPLPFRLVRPGRHYDVWQRPPGPPPAENIHLPIGTAVDPASTVACSTITDFAGRAGPGGALAYVERPPNVVVSADQLEAPSSWSRGSGGAVHPRGSGTATADLEVTEPGSYMLWLGGSVRGRMEALVDGTKVGSIRHVINNHGLYVELGDTELAAGEHTVELRYAGTDLHPGSGGSVPPIGPLVLSSSEASEALIEQIPSARASELCGRHLDWIEALPGLRRAGSSP